MQGNVCQVYRKFDIYKLLSRTDRCFIKKISRLTNIDGSSKIINIDCDVDNFKSFFCRENKSLLKI